MEKQNSRDLETMPMVNVEDVRAQYDPELPNASAVLAAISCISAQYAKKPSASLALLRF